MSQTAQSYPFPVLGSDRMDYAPDAAYTTSEWRVADNQAHLRHQIIGDSYVARMVAEGRAQFGVAVVMKATMYRRTFITDNNGELSVSQFIPIEKSSRSIELPKLMPMVIYTGDDQSVVADETMGLDKLWLGRKFSLPKGAILARGQDLEFEPSLEQLLRVKKNPHMREGGLEVDISSADSGFFVVDVHPNLFDSMRSAQAAGGGKRHHLNSILTQALHAGFAQLAQRFNEQDEEIQTLENFQSVKRQLDRLGVAAWDDQEEFDPCKAACAYYPHLLEVNLSKDDDDE